MHHLNHLRIWRDANRLLLAIGEAVREFPRYHKYIWARSCAGRPWVSAVSSCAPPRRMTSARGRFSSW